MQAMRDYVMLIADFSILAHVIYRDFFNSKYLKFHYKEIDFFNSFAPTSIRNICFDQK